MRCVSEFDYIIAGAGAAGMHLAYQLNKIGLTHKRILLLDRASPGAADRTWCFWEDHPNELEPIVYRSWRVAQLYATGFERALNFAPYSYKMIRGPDFFSFMRDWIARQPNIVIRQGDVTDIRTQGDHAVATFDGKTVQARFAFSSLPRQPTGGTTHLIQHFYGAVIQTAQPCFNPAQPTLMDFRVPQYNDVRFCYVLPFDEHTALVEFTVFSPTVLAREEYVNALRLYIKHDDYTVTQEEYGEIPMTDARFAPGDGDRVINIGIAGGLTKPSTGYTFLRTQQHARRIATSLAAGLHPGGLNATGPARHQLFDAIFLNVLARHRRPGSKVFTELFSRNPTSRVIRFLDEQSSLTEDLQIMSSMHLRPFIAATIDVLAMRLRNHL